MTYFVYILECSNGSYYTGYTTDIERRYQEHVSGSGKCKYTRSFPPVELSACWQTQDLSIALKVERFIKSCKKSDKQILIQKPERIMKKLKALGFQEPLTTKKLQLFSNPSLVAAKS